MNDLRPRRDERFFRRTLLALSLFAGLASAARGEERWTPLGPVGGAVRRLAQAPSDPSRLYAATERTGLFASRDGGRSWQSIRGGILRGDIQRLAVAPGDPGAVLVATTGDVPFFQVWRSRDGGATWAPATAPPAFEGEALLAQDLIFDPVDARTAYAATDHGIYRTLDGGATWGSWALPHVAASVIARAPGARGSWFAAGFDQVDFRGEIYRSDDGGATWRETPPNPFGLPERMFFRAGALYALRTGALFRSTDRATTWSLAARLPTLEAIDFAIAPSGTIFAATSTGVYSSADGTNWSPPEVLSPGEGAPRDLLSHLAILPGSPRPGSETVIAGGRRGLWRSADRGATWKPASRGIAVHDVESLIVIPDPEGTVLGTIDDGIYRIERDRKSWQRLPLMAGFEFPALAADPHHSGRVYALGQSGAVGVSEDRGNSWTQIAKLRSDAAQSFLVDPVHPDVLYAGVRDGLGSRGEDVAYKSIDGGAHWTEFLDDLLFDVAFDPNRPNVGFRLTRNGIDRTTDGGNHWVRLENLGAQLLGSGAASILIDSRSRALYVGTEDRGIFRSTDSGRTFRRIAAGLPRLPGGHHPAASNLIQDATGDIYAALPFSGVYRLNPGQGWTAVNAGLPLETFVRTLIADPEVPGLLYAGSIGSSVHRLEDR